MYKTPILPARYKGAKVIPDFLKEKRSHVPIPMSRKDKRTLPSLGFAEKVKKKKEKGKVKDTFHDVIAHDQTKGGDPTDHYLAQKKTGGKK